MNIQSRPVLKWFGFFILCMIIVFVSATCFKLCRPGTARARSNNIIKTEKELRWQETSKEVESWGDALGMGIDPEIKKTVIVLNLLGFKTMQSCEGHMDWGLPYPWVSFDTHDAEIEALNAKDDEVQKQIDAIELSIQKKSPELSVVEANRKEDSPERDALYKKLHEIQNEREKKRKLKLLPLHNLLTDFYKGRCVESDMVIFVGPLNRIYSIGGEWQITRDVEEKKLKLAAYQKEMGLFADFLTDYYFKT